MFTIQDRGLTNGYQNLASATSEIWSAALQVPFKKNILNRPPPQQSSRSFHDPKVAIQNQPDVRPAHISNAIGRHPLIETHSSTPLPDFFASTPTSALRIRSLPEMSTMAPTTMGIFASGIKLFSDEPIQASWIAFVYRER